MHIKPHVNKISDETRIHIQVFEFDFFNITRNDNLMKNYRAKCSTHKDKEKLEFSKVSSLNFKNVYYI